MKIKNKEREKNWNIYKNIIITILLLSVSGGIAATTTPTLEVSPLSGPQKTSFQYTGNDLTPTGDVDLHILKPDGTEYIVKNLLADNSGKISYQYLSTCDSLVGSYTAWVIDRAANDIKSNDVTHTISASPDCTVTPITSITVVFPNGGENWQAGTTQTIQWTYMGDPGPNVKIELLKSLIDNAPVIITSSTPIGSNGAGSYNWNIPQDLATGAYLVRVTSTTDIIYSDTSDAHFTISGQKIPDPPSNLVATQFRTSQTKYFVSLDWKDNSDNEDEFIIEKSDKIEGPYKQIERVGTNKVYTYDGDVKLSNTYYYRVNASNSIGFSISNIVSIKVVAPHISKQSDETIIATEFDFPFEKELYIPGSYGGRDMAPLVNNHLGEDINPRSPYNQFASYPIKAIADGKIVYYGTASGYGELIAVVEHDLGKEFTFNLYTADKTPLFIWENVPGKDEKSLLNLLKTEFGITFQKPKIEKIENEMAIHIYDDKTSILLRLNDKRNIVSLITGNGEVKELVARMHYGKLTVFKKISYTKNTRYITSFYGHIRSRSIRDGTGTNLEWKNDDTIKKGEIIGYVNDDIGPSNQTNGDGAEHIHMGIRLAINSGDWQWPGYLCGKAGCTNYENFAAFSQIIEQLPR